MDEAMAAFFDRLLTKWEQAGLGLPRAPWDPDADDRIWQGPPDENEYAPWRPLRKTERHDLSLVASDLGPLHRSIDEYFNAWWFAALEGGYGDFGLTLMRVLPGLELDGFLPVARGYAELHGGLEHVPLGVEFNGLQVVVDNSTGAVGIEDWERGAIDVIAPSLRDLLLGLEP